VQLVLEKSDDSLLCLPFRFADIVHGRLMAGVKFRNSPPHKFIKKWYGKGHIPM
jgi:hypothetical protein